MLGFSTQFGQQNISSASKGRQTSMNSEIHSKPKILVVSRNPVGGIRTYFRYVYSQDSMARYYKTLHLPYDDNIEFYDNAFDQVVLEYSSVSQSINKYWIGIMKSIIFNRPDIVHSHGLKTGVFLAPFLGLLRIKHIVTLHDVFDAYDFKGVKGKFKKWIINIAFKFMDVINPCGRDVGVNIHEFFPNVRNDKVKVIQNGISVEQFHADHKRDLKTELQIKPDTILLGYFGRFMRQKGFDILRDAIIQLKAAGFKFEVACFGWGGFIREEQAELKRLDIDSQFHFLPHTDEVGFAMRGLDVVVIPSRWEACPLLPMEALVAGVPVIASNCIGLRDVCIDTPSVIFRSEASGALSEAIKKFKNDQEKILEQTTMFRKNALQRFDVKATSNALKMVYDDLL